MPPDKRKSTVFIASSIAIIDIKLIPIAVLKEWPELIPCNLRITVQESGSEWLTTVIA